MLQGRGITEQDNENAPLVTLINQTMVIRLWPNQNPIGKRIGVKPTDPGTLTSVVLLLAVIALIASLVPAIRASRVSPLIALKSE